MNLLTMQFKKWHSNFKITFRKPNLPLINTIVWKPEFINFMHNWRENSTWASKFNVTCLNWTSLVDSLFFGRNFMLKRPIQGIFSKLNFPRTPNVCKVTLLVHKKKCDQIFMQDNNKNGTACLVNFLEMYAKNWF